MQKDSISQMIIDVGGAYCIDCIFAHFSAIERRGGTPFQNDASIRLQIV